MSDMRIHHNAPTHVPTRKNITREQLGSIESTGRAAGEAFETNISRPWASSKELGTPKLLDQTKSKKVAGHLFSNHHFVQNAKGIKTPRS